MPPLPLPPQLRVLVRDWLSANHVLLRSPAGHVLVDTGYGSTFSRTWELLTAPDALGPEPLALVVNTHCHSDHMGGNAELRRRFGCPVAIPEGEAPLIEAWDERALFLGWADQAAEPFPVDRLLRPGTTEVWGDLEWRVLAAPGHDAHALIFHNPEHGILLSGDALWGNGFGFVLPLDLQPDGLQAARATLELIASLDAKVVIPGHGAPFTDVAAALDRATRRLAIFEADPERLCRHAPKVILAYTFLHRGRMPLADMPAYVARVGLHREFNHRYFKLTPEAYADWIVKELLKSGAIRQEGTELVAG
jgi:glyoxylase-like metal-dependent hydrolase (beta-lactamase superfamily II)